jgi:hypothetical protein
MKVDYKLWAPYCVFPDCNVKVGYHNRYLKEDQTPGFKWKGACEPHRTNKKIEMDKWKILQGCANVDGRYGNPCTATITGPEQIDVHHKDANRHNNNQENLECLCRNCHGMVTKQEGHSKNSYNNTIVLNTNLFEVV